jgi:hypothetical protein
MIGTDLTYPAAVGCLQARCIQAAITIESVLENTTIEDWAKALLLEAAKGLRRTNGEVEDLVTRYELGEAA